jgi:hypothetical protein
VTENKDDQHGNDVERPPVQPEHHVSNQSQHHNTERPVAEVQQVFTYEYNHTEIYSASSTDRTYLRIDFSGSGAYDPSLIPHPILKDTWIIAAQGMDEREKGEDGPYEYVCNAMLNEKGIMHCTTPAVLPVPPPWNPHDCPRATGHLKISSPRQSRIFYGPTTPYLTYKVDAEYTCTGRNTSKHSGNYVQDLRSLIYLGTKPSAADPFSQSTRLDIPAAAGNMAGKNLFLFWDTDNQTYAHYALSPNRVYGKLDPSGSVVKDNSMQLPASESTCLREYLPPTGKTASIEQATNSLSITTCKRSDEDCVVSPSNTFIMTIFQHTSSRGAVTIAEPYIILFDRTAPFATHGISKRPLWISGRGGRPEGNGVIDPSQVEKLNIISMSWKGSTQKYNGYADDVIHLAFGIEGKMTAVLDVVASDLLENLGLCSGLT